MKATKFKVTVEIEVLSMDCVPHMLSKALDQIQNEHRAGVLIAEDGDELRWNVGSEEVKF